MKRRIFPILVPAFISFFLLAGCGKDVSPVEPITPEEPWSLILEGKMMDWSRGAGKQLRFGKYFGGLDEAFALGIINEDGSFRIAVPPVSSSKLIPVTQIYDTTSWSRGLTMSDSTAKFYIGEPVIYSGSEFLGGIINSEIRESLADSSRLSFYSVLYYYVDKDVNIKGTVKSKSSNGLDWYTSFSISFKTGWNKVIKEFDINTSYYDYTNEIPFNGQYKFNGVITID